MIAFGLLNKNKKILSILIFLMGFSFHKSIVFFSFIYFKVLYKLYLKLLLKNKILIIILALLFSILIPHFLLWHPKFYDYFYFSKTNKSFYIKYILFVFYYFYCDLKNKNNKKIEFFIFYGLCILSFFINFKLLSSRLIYYLNIFIPILLVNYLNRIRKINRNIIICLICIYHIMILFYPSVSEEFKFFNLYNYK